MANNFKSKLKRLGSKKRSDADSSEDLTDSQTKSIGSSRSSILGAPPAVQAPSAPRKSGEGSVYPESSSGISTVQPEVPAVDPKVETAPSGAQKAAVVASQSHKGSVAQASKQTVNKPKEQMKPSEENKHPLAGASITGEPLNTNTSSASTPGPKPVATTDQSKREESLTSQGPSKSQLSARGSSEGSSTASADSKQQPYEAPAISPSAEEAPLEIKTVGGKQYVFKQKTSKSSPSNPPTSSSANHAVSARPSPVPSPLRSRSASPVPSSRTTKHATFLIDSKHGQSHSVPGRPLSRSSSRNALQRTPSMAQMTRDNKSNLSNDTRHFYQNSHGGNTGGHLDARPPLSRKSSYADDKRAMEYISNKNPEATAESSNLMFRTSSRIWDANKESDMWFNYESRSRISSRRESIASSDTDSEEDENLHPGRFISRSGSFASDEDEEAEFADSYIIRAADWLLGIPHDSPHTLRNTFKRKPKPMSLLDKRRLREANVVTDPAFLLAAYMSLREAMS